MPYFVPLPKNLFSPHQDFFLTFKMDYSITLQEKRAFHKIDRQVYARLLIEIGFDSLTAKKIVSFWFWIEREGCRNFIVNMVYLPTPVLRTLAMETITCLHVIYSMGLIGINAELPHMRCLLGQAFCLERIFERRVRAQYVIEKFIKDVCNDVFSDIFHAHTSQAIMEEVPLREDSDKSKSNSFNGVDVRQDSDLDPETDRTLFITFSRGHPLSRQELRNLITRKIGDCVEAIRMRERPPPLFARVILNSAAAMARILGKNDLVKLQVNGKHAWVRRFTPRQKVENLVR